MKSPFIVKIATIILFSLSSLVIIAGSFLLTKAANKTGTVQIVTNPLRYQEIRNQIWPDVEPIKHFPAQIPTDAKAVRMAYSPGLMQGSSFLQIRFQQPPDKIQKLLSKYSKISQHQYQGGDTNDHSRQLNGVPTTFFYTSQSETQAFPNTYKILVLKAQNKGKPGFQWNHGNSYGVAIDSSASEIVYWAEEW
jgi:hypothetical protein